jgi:hypothetical protein
VGRTNLTIQLDTETVRRARIVAAKRGTSISQLVGRELEDLVQADARYEAAMLRAEELMRGAIDRGGVSWTREELHER